MFHNMFIIDLTCQLEKDDKNDDVKKVVKQASVGPLKGYIEDQVASYDFSSDPTFSPLMLGLALLSMITL